MWFLLAVAFSNLYLCISNPIVEVNQGKIKGSLRRDINGDEFYSFQSIPYAKPPLGNLRFKAPEPADSWDGLLDGTKNLVPCAQSFFGKIVGQEDCLHVNIYTKKINREKSEKLRPVMVYLHGGAYMLGSADEQKSGPEYLLTEEIVLVAFHYRLGVFGILSFHDQTSGVPGNANLKDQVMALKWIHENIHKFGGNCSDVTLFGVSAGGASIHMHMLSPMSKGLFHKAVLQSGTALHLWNNGLLGTGELLAEALDIKESDPKIILERLRTLSTETLIDAQQKTFGHLRIHTPWPHAPVIEKQTNEPAFLTDNQIEIIESGNYSHVPIMIGHTNAEGIINYVFSGEPHVSPELYDSVPNDLNIKIGSVEANAIENEIKEFFFDGRTPTDDDIQQSIKLMSSIWYVYPAYRSIKLHLLSTIQPIYLYVFSADTVLNSYKKLNNVTAKYPGASHMDDTVYLLKPKNPPPMSKHSLERKCVDSMVKLWTNFAKYGNPTPERDEFGITWQPVTKTSFNFVEIGTNGLSVGKNPVHNMVKFWNSIYRRYHN